MGGWGQAKTYPHHAHPTYEVPLHQPPQLQFEPPTHWSPEQGPAIAFISGWSAWSTQGETHSKLSEQKLCLQASHMYLSTW